MDNSYFSQNGIMEFYAYIILIGVSYNTQNMLFSQTEVAFMFI